MVYSKDWEEDCLRWWGRILTGQYTHWCPEWDYLPIDNTTKEFEACVCYKGDKYENHN